MPEHECSQDRYERIWNEVHHRKLNEALLSGGDLLAVAKGDATHVRFQARGSVLMRFV